MVGVCVCVRDLRLRQYLGVRFDAIPNVFDWDFHMKLVDKGVNTLDSAESNLLLLMLEMC